MGRSLTRLGSGPSPAGHGLVWQPDVCSTGGVVNQTLGFLYIRKQKCRCSLVSQQVKNPALSLLSLGLLLWHGFDPWSRNFCLPWAQPKKKKKKKQTPLKNFKFSCRKVLWTVQSHFIFKEMSKDFWGARSVLGHLGFSLPNPWPWCGLVFHGQVLPCGSTLPAKPSDGGCLSKGSPETGHVSVLCQLAFQLLPEN